MYLCVKGYWQLTYRVSCLGVKVNDCPYEVTKPLWITIRQVSANHVLLHYHLPTTNTAVATVYIEVWRTPV